MTRSILAVSLVLAAGCTEATRTSLIRTPRSESAALKATAQDLAGRRVLVIGHKAGACDVYPHDPVDKIPSQPVPAADLLMHPDLGPFDAAELDVHVSPDGTPYVTHDAQDLDKLRKVLAKEGIDPDQFLRRSGLAESITSYFGKHGGGQLFIELKSGKSNQKGQTEDDRRLAAAVKAQLDQVAQKLGEPTLQRITFTSFRITALQALHELAAAPHPGLGYALILGTDKSLFLLFSDLPDTRDQLEALAKPESKFISQAWFSLESLGSPAQVLGQVRSAGVEKLVSDAYLEKPDDLKDGLRKLSAQGIAVAGLVFDTVANPANTGGNKCPP